MFNLSCDDLLSFNAIYIYYKYHEKSQARNINERQLEKHIGNGWLSKRSPFLVDINAVRDNKNKYSSLLTSILYSLFQLSSSQNCSSTVKFPERWSHGEAISASD